MAGTAQDGGRVARLGSFAAPVDLPEHLRPWSAAGLSTLLLPGGLPAQELAQVTAQPDKCDRSLPDAESASGFAPNGRMDWPEPWRSIAIRIRTTPKIIFTYAELTADVTGNADPVRRKLFQSILGYTAWPQGTCLFWPCLDLPGAPALAKNIFLNGVLQFGVAHIACFGSEAARLATALFQPGDGRPDVLVHSLPAPEALTGLLPHELHRAVALLKELRLE